MPDTPGFYPMQGGMNWSVPPHALSDEFAAIMQDIVLDQPGFIRRRGPLTRAQYSAVDVQVISDNPLALIHCEAPNGDLRVALVTIDDATGDIQFRVYSDDKQSFPVSIELDTGHFNSSPTYRNLCSWAPMLGGGVYIGVSDTIGPWNGRKECAILWHGSNKASYSTGTITTSRGSATVTGSGTSWSSSNAEAGMYLFNSSGHFIGRVKTVDSSTEITLDSEALLTITAAAYFLEPIREPLKRHTKGTITTKTNSATVIGSGTFFRDGGIGSHDLFRASDMQYIGTVTSIQKNTSLTLTGNAAIALDNEYYIAVNTGQVTRISTSNASSLTSSRVGFLSVFHEGRQWFANHGFLGRGNRASRLWFSEFFDPEGWFVSDSNGDHFNVGSVSDTSEQPITALASISSGLLVFKPNELFLLRGNTPENFSLEKVADIGTISPNNVQSWGPGVIFTSREGIHFFDGEQFQDLHSNLAPQTQTFRNQEIDAYCTGSAIVRDHYIVYFEFGYQPPYGIIKDAGTETFPITMSLAVNLKTNAIVQWTNVAIIGKAVTPYPTLGTWALVRTDFPTTYVINLDKLFTDADGTDIITCENNTIGPDFYLETKKYDFDDPFRLKYLRDIGITRKAVQDELSIAIHLGLHRSTGWTELDPISQSSTHELTQIAVERVAPAFGFIIHEDPVLIEASIGTISFNVKPLRSGRIVYHAS